MASQQFIVIASYLSSYVLSSLKGCGSLYGWYLKKCLILLDLSKASRFLLVESSSGAAVGTEVRPLERRPTSASVRDNCLY